MSKIYNRKTVLATTLAMILALSAVAVVGVPQAFAQNDTSNSILRQILRIVQDIQQTVSNADYGLKEIKREVRIVEDVAAKTKEGVERIGEEITNPNYGLKEIKEEVRNIEDITGKTNENVERLGHVITNPDYGLKEIKREVRNIELGQNLEKDIVMKELAFPVDVRDLQIVTIPKEQEGFLEELSCILKDAGAWASNGGARVLVTVKNTNGNVIAECHTGGNRPSSNFVDDFPLPTSSGADILVPRLRLAGGETVHLSCLSTNVVDQGCSVEVDLWLKLRNKPLPTPADAEPVLATP